MKPTPGPWVIKTFMDYPTERYPRWRRVYLIYAPQEESYVAKLFTASNYIARLIATAPKLLEACEKIHSAIGHGDPIDISNVCAEYVIPAIAEAGGRE